ncbi:hypothetical protein HN615_09455 [Candidatus Woesearchaeota archaeon]|jgi:hypothetical protein|nr:hypothetical protein [Candidatus Woesearchaeota archaeon]
MAKEKSQFPTEMISLPSKGYFYPEDNPLSSGEVEVKYMTAREEDILTSTNLIQKGIVLDKLLDALVVSDVDLDDILIGDKNAIMVAARVLAYGKDYTFDFVDPSSGNKRDETVDLTSLENKKINFNDYEKGKNEFDFKLPGSKRKLTFKLLTQRDEKANDSQLKALKKISKSTGIDPEITTRLKSSIIAVDGNRDDSVINSFVDNEFLSIDSFAYRVYLTTITPDVDLSFTVELDNGEVEEVAVPVTATFFWPSTSR